jgi:HEAT repeat protein
LEVPTGKYGRIVEAIVALDGDVSLQMLDGLSRLSERHDSPVATNAAFAVGEIGRLMPSSVNEPLRRLSDGDAPTRRLAAEILGLLQRPERRVLVRLVACATEPSEALEVRRRCIQSLGSMRTPAMSTARTLRSLARDEDPVLRTAAAHALASVHPEASAREQKRLRAVDPQLADEIDRRARLHNFRCTFSD